MIDVYICLCVALYLLVGCVLVGLIDRYTSLFCFNDERVLMVLSWVITVPIWCIFCAVAMLVRKISGK